MRKVLFLVLLLACVCVNGQSVQYGYTKEYRGADEKTPLADVNIVAGGATAKSAENGRFRLQFSSLNVGDPVNADLNKVAMLKGYVLFNKDAVEQWVVSGKGTSFNIIMCERKRFEERVRQANDVGVQSADRRLREQREQINRLKSEKRIQQQEYERKLREAQEEYDRAKDLVNQYANLFARFDESEMDDEQEQMLELWNGGRFEELQGMIYQSIDKGRGNLAKSISKRDSAERILNEAKTEIDRQINVMKQKITYLAMIGGKQNMDTCSKMWMDIVAADSANAKNLWDAGCFFDNQQNYEVAVRLYLKALDEYRKQAVVFPAFNLQCAKVMSNLANLYADRNECKRAEEYYLLSQDVFRSLADQDSDRYNADYADLLNNMGLFYRANNRYKEAEQCYALAYELLRVLVGESPELYNAGYATLLNNMADLYNDASKHPIAGQYYHQALAIYRSLAAADSLKYNADYAWSLNNTAMFCSETNRYDTAEVCFLEALRIRKSLAGKNPDSYNSDYAVTLVCLAELYSDMGEYEMAERYYGQGLDVYKTLAANNPEVYNHDYAWALNSLGVLCCERQEFERALIYCDEALQIRDLLRKGNPDAYNPDYAMSLNNIANIYLQTGETDKAETYYKQALKLAKSMAERNPDVYTLDYAKVMSDVAYFYAVTGMQSKAQKSFKSALNMLNARKDSAALRLAAEIYGVCAFSELIYWNLEDAEQYARLSLSVDNAQLQVKTSLILAMLFQGRCDEAEGMALELRNLQYEGQPYKEYLFQRLGDFEGYLAEYPEYREIIGHFKMVVND